MTKENELLHFNEISAMKKRHLVNQHDSEINNQNDYNKRALEDLRKQHAMQSKQQPRELKVFFTVFFFIFNRAIFLE